MPRRRPSLWSVGLLGLAACSGAASSTPERPAGGAGGATAGAGGGAAAGDPGGTGGDPGGTGGDPSGGAGAGTLDDSGAGAGGFGGGGISDAPHDVTFEWPQTLPGAGTCKAGAYSGAFNGIFSPSAVFYPAPIPVTGDVQLTLDESTNGEFFSISNGKVSGLADGLFPYACDVIGSLNCVTLKLDNTFLKNCTYTVGISSYPFEGPMTADYDMANAAFINGTWKGVEPNPTFGGSGNWGATWHP